MEPLLTIVSRNYLAAARVLCSSFLEHHPKGQAFVLLVDRDVDSLDLANEPFDLVRLQDIGIPDLDLFLSQYTVLEANTAVKPFALRHLFEKYQFKKLVYLDPDIWVHGRLDAIWEALDRHDIVVTPHIRRPYADGCNPSELNVLQSGVYNLGFVGLRSGPETDRMLGWWADKTEMDCIVDVANGIFVDQKWMDLLPGYFPGLRVLREPEYNIAYWNLHERTLTKVGAKYFVDGRPLKFFHFSGYSPRQRQTLSKHDGRHTLTHLPVVHDLCSGYAMALLSAGYQETSEIPYGFDTLPNGIPCTHDMRRLVRSLRQRHIAFPSPAGQPDEFCSFVMTPNSRLTGEDCAPVLSALLANRPDVVAAYPLANRNNGDPEFGIWLATTGASEHNIQELCRRFGFCLNNRDPFVRIKSIYDRRPDLRRAFPEAFLSEAGLAAFHEWLRTYGIAEERISEQEIQQFISSATVKREYAYDVFFASPSLQERYPLGLTGDDPAFLRFLLTEGLADSDLTATQIYWLHQNLAAKPNDGLLATALYGSWLRSQIPLAGTVFGWPTLIEWAGGRTSLGPRVSDAVREGVSPLAQLEMLYASTPNLDAALSRPFDSARQVEALAAHAKNLVGAGSHGNANWLKSLDREVASYCPAAGMNLAGYFRYPAGMGQGVHALAAALDAVDIPHADVCIPAGSHSGSAEFRTEDNTPLGWHRPEYRTSLTFVNADQISHVRRQMSPAFFRDRFNIAHWVWETNRLPDRYAESAAGFDEIWTPSTFSAEAIRAIVDKPVSVIPVSVVAPDGVQPTFRARWGIPDDTVVFAFSFDARSFIERKNPQAVIRAFRKAFSSNERAVLVIKVNQGRGKQEELRTLKKLADGLPVLWLEEPLTRPAVWSFLQSADVIVSLHRAEGFGALCSEAMALGKPVIATGYSGNVDFMDSRSARLVGYRLVKTDKAHGPYPAGTEWAEPDEEAAVAYMRELQSDAEHRAHLGNMARENAMRLLSPAAVGERIRARLLAKDHAQPGAMNVDGQPRPVSPSGHTSERNVTTGSLRPN